MWERITDEWFRRYAAGTITFDPRRVRSRWLGSPDEHHRFQLILNAGRRARPGQNPAPSAPAMPTTCFMDDADRYLISCGGLFALANEFPVRFLHLLLVPGEHREDVFAKDLADAQEFAVASPHCLVFHNRRGSAATRPEHLHLQVVLRDQPLLLERAPRDPLFELDGARVSRVADPAYALAVAGERAPEVAYVVTRALDARPFNIVINAAEIIVIPRGLEQPSGWSSRFGGLEMAGAIVVTDEDRYEQATADGVRAALTECGVDGSARDAIEWAVLHALIQSTRGATGVAGLRLQRLPLPDLAPGASRGQVA